MKVFSNAGNADVQLLMEDAFSNVRPTNMSIIIFSIIIRNSCMVLTSLSSICNRMERLFGF